jgi:hypothetical protein
MRILAPWALLIEHVSRSSVPDGAEYDQMLPNGGDHITGQASGNRNITDDHNKPDHQQ